MQWWLAYLAIGAVAGFIAGLLGIGGGAVIVPLLVFAFTSQGVPETHLLHLALATTMATIVFTSVSSARAHHSHGSVDWTMARMPYHKKRRVLPEILSPEEIAAIFDTCHNLKHKTLLMTSYSGGMRLGETLGLVPSDIDSTRMMIRIEQGKGRKDRYVMLSPTLLEILRTYWKAFRPARWLFEGRRSGEPLSPSTAEKVFTAAAGRAGIRKGVSFHSLRHAFATHLLEGGTNIRVIQALLGHQCLTTTQVYTHVARTYVNATTSPLDRLKEKKEEPDKE